MAVRRAEHYGERGTNMKKTKLVLCTAAMTMAMTWCVCAGETMPEETAETPAAEAMEVQEDNGIRIWQGYLDGTSYTFRVDMENQLASVAKTQSDGALELITGSYTVDEAGSLIVTAEDGTAQTWTASTVSSCQLTAGCDAGEVTLARADSNLEDQINDYAWYTGLSEEGDAYTYGISLDCTQIIFGFYTAGDETLYETEFTLSQTGGGDGTITATATDEDGNAYAFGYEMIDENPLHVNITLNGETIEASAVEARTFEGYVEETAE